MTSMSNPYEITPHIAHASAPLLGDMSLFIERIGGWPRISVILAFIVYMVIAIVSSIRIYRAAGHGYRRRDQVALLTYDKDAVAP